MVEDKGEDFGFLFNKTRQVSGARVADRMAAEKRAMKPNDGRRLRTSGRTEQLNLRVRRAFKDDLYALSKKTGLTLGALVERGVEKLKGELDRGT
jgi:hypothetical protein